MNEHRPDAGEQGLDSIEKELIAERNKVRDLEAKLAKLENGQTLLELGAAADRLEKERDAMTARCDVLRDTLERRGCDPDCASMKPVLIDAPCDCYSGAVLRDTAGATAEWTQGIIDAATKLAAEEAGTAKATLDDLKTLRRGLDVAGNCNAEDENFTAVSDLPEWRAAFEVFERLGIDARVAWGLCDGCEGECVPGDCLKRRKGATPP